MPEPTEERTEDAPALPGTEAQQAGQRRTGSRLLECRIAPDRVAELADAQADTHLEIKRMREELAAYQRGVREAINERLRRLDGLADKVKHARYHGYVLCYETVTTGKDGKPVLQVERADTGETWEEALPPGAQISAVAEAPAPPEKAKGKACTCPAPQHAQPGETWFCPVKEHGHMWCDMGGEIVQAPADPTEALEDVQADGWSSIDPDDGGGAE